MPAPVIAMETRCEALCRVPSWNEKHGLQNNNALLNFYEKLLLFCKGAIKNEHIIPETAFRTISCKCLLYFAAIVGDCRFPLIGLCLIPKLNRHFEWLKVDVQ